MNARRFVFRLRRLGWPGMLGVALLLASAGLYFGGVVPRQNALDALHTRLLARQAAQRHPQVAAVDVGTPTDQLARFHQAFPVETSLPDWLDKVFAVARDKGIAIDQGDYTLTRNLAGPLVRVQISLPLRSSYPQLRKFLAGVKEEIPALALEHLQLERQKIADADLSATVKLALYMEPSP